MPRLTHTVRLRLIVYPQNIAFRCSFLRLSFAAAFLCAGLRYSRQNTTIFAAPDPIFIIQGRTQFQNSSILKIYGRIQTARNLTKTIESFGVLLMSAMDVRAQ